jgi:hypothetical protein
VTGAPVPLAPAATAAAGTLQVAPFDQLYAVFGPFVFPVVLFVAGIVGYVLLLWLVRAGVVGEDRWGRNR